MKYLLAILLLFFIGCSSSVKIVEKQVPVIVETPGRADTIELKKQNEAEEPLLFGTVEDSLKNQIGELKVFFEKKIALLSLKPRVDTITVHLVDTVKIRETEFLPIVNEQLSFIEKIFLYTGIGLIFSIITYLRVKKFGRKL